MLNRHFINAVLVVTSLAMLSSVHAAAKQTPLEKAVSEAKSAWRAAEPGSAEALSAKQRWLAAQAALAKETATNPVKNDASAGSKDVVSGKAKQTPLEKAVSEAKRAWKAAPPGSAEALAAKQRWLAAQAALARGDTSEAEPTMPVVESSKAFTARMQATLTGKGIQGANLVADTCRQPDPVVSRVIHIDPATGTSKGDGSLEKPFRTLAEVLTHNKSLLKNGAELMLGTGQHGVINIGDLGNQQFVRITAAPGAVPVVKNLAMQGTHDVMFTGILFEAGPRIKTNRTIAKLFPGTSNIIFRGSTFQTTADVSQWTDVDWVSTSFDGMYSRATCLTMVGNTVRNVRNGIWTSGKKALIYGNTLRDIGTDGIIFTASDQVIRYNQVLDGHNSALNNKGAHADGMQGWTEAEPVNRNVVIDSNLVVAYQPMLGTPKSMKEFDLNLMGSYRQGISIFDGEWDGLTVTNNVVITNAVSAMVFRGPKNALIAHNTLLSSDPQYFDATLAVKKAKNGASSANVKVVNNLVYSLETTGGVSSANNVVLNKSNGKKVGDGMMDRAVRQLDIGGRIYDVRAKIDGLDLMVGNAALAPATDLMGATRQAVDGKVPVGALGL